MDGFHNQMKLPRDDARRVQQVFYDLNLCLSIPFDHVQRAVEIRAAQVGTTEQMNAAENRCERCSKFVRYHRDEFVFQAIGFLCLSIHFSTVDCNSRCISQSFSQRQMWAGEIGMWLCR